MIKLFKRIDDRLLDIGFRKIREDKHGVEYQRFNEKYNYTQVVVISHKQSGAHILQSYDNSLFDSKDVGNTNVGLTGYEVKLFLKKMKSVGLA